MLSEEVGDIVHGRVYDEPARSLAVMLRYLGAVHYSRRHDDKRAQRQEAMKENKTQKVRACGAKEKKKKKKINKGQRIERETAGKDADVGSEPERNWRNGYSMCGNAIQSWIDGIRWKQPRCRTEESSELTVAEC